MNIEDNFEEFNSDDFPLLSKEEEENLKKALSEKTKNVVFVNLKKSPEQKIQDKIGFLMSLLAAGVVTKSADGNVSHEFLIHNDSFDRDIIQREIIKFTKKYLRMK